MTLEVGSTSALTHRSSPSRSRNAIPRADVAGWCWHGRVSLWTRALHQPRRPPRALVRTATRLQLLAERTSQSRDRLIVSLSLFVGSHGSRVRRPFARSSSGTSASSARLVTVLTSSYSSRANMYRHNDVATPAESARARGHLAMRGQLGCCESPGRAVRAMQRSRPIARPARGVQASSVYPGASTIALPPPRRVGSAAARTRPLPRNSMPVTAPISGVVENGWRY